ncbi:MAG: hypothetical protein J6Q50_01580, partial [Clostridia bacterium]|nr:hypothetical protein [Clostridia bacterium]
GRIHPSRIEETVEKSRKEVEAVIKKEGEQATYETGVHGINPELIKLGKKSNGIGLIVNTFEFDNSNAVKDFDTSYSETNITIIVNNNKNLIEMEYNLNGISNCVFDEKNTSFEYKAQFTFNNKYLYEFKYR